MGKSWWRGRKPGGRKGRVGAGGGSGVGEKVGGG